MVCIFDKENRARDYVRLYALEKNIFQEKKNEEFFQDKKVLFLCSVCVSRFEQDFPTEDCLNKSRILWDAGYRA